VVGLLTTLPSVPFFFFSMSLPDLGPERGRRLRTPNARSARASWTGPPVVSFKCRCWALQAAAHVVARAGPPCTLQHVPGTWRNPQHPLYPFPPLAVGQCCRRSQTYRLCETSLQFETYSNFSSWSRGWPRALDHAKPSCRCRGSLILIGFPHRSACYSFPPTPRKPAHKPKCKVMLVALLLTWPGTACTTPAKPMCCVTNFIRLLRRPNATKPGMSTGSWRSAARGVCCPA
jgi:hypothetical protein